MKLLSWNILQGGGDRLESICKTVSEYGPDVIVLCEVRNSSLSYFSSSLWLQDWPYRSEDVVGHQGNGILVMSRTPFAARLDHPLPAERDHRWIDLHFPNYGMGIGALHIPNPGDHKQSNGNAKRKFWDAILVAATDRVNEPFLFVGDFNTGSRRIDESGSTFLCAAQFERLTRIGFIDAWRRFNGGAFEPTWISNRKNGFRLDHAFVSPALRDRLVECRYSHTEREAGVSDHSILCVEIR